MIVALSVASALTFRPIRSLEGKWFEIFYGFVLIALLSALIAEIFRLAVAWLEFRPLLQALDRLPLRRGFERLKGQTWTSIWRLGGNSSVDLYRLVSREIESLQHLGNLKPEIPMLKVEVKETTDELENISLWFRHAREAMKHGKPETVKLSEDMLSKFGGLQRQLGRVCGQTLMYLNEEWDKEFRTIRTGNTPVETESDLVIGFGKQSERNLVGPNPVYELDSRLKLQEKEPKGTDLAEDFVCQIYVNYILRMLLRMKTLVIAIGGMYVFALLSFASYPFEPKSFFHTLMILLLALIVGIVGLVLAQMHRDATLSRITDTKPGELGLDFWFRLVAFVAVPLFSLLASQFPEIGNFLFSWMQPALQAFK
jgi:hypothetical protein